MQFITLSQAFYDDYKDCSEIEQKNNRPYIRTVIKCNGYYFAVPLRSHIKHKYVLWTDEENRCGLDFSKSVVILKNKYIGDVKPIIRQNEFDSLKGKEHLIKQKLIQYINTYKKAKKRVDVPRNKTICDCSTLQYFEKYI